jgi:hypothetical protein
MRLTKFLALLVIVMLTSCKLDPPHSVYTDVLIPVTERLVPRTAVVNQPFTIYAMATMDNGCWSNIRFVFDETDDRQYELIGLADFETYGSCPDVLVGGDTTITVTPTRTGNHVLTVWMDHNTSEKDTILVVAAAPGK